jgi:hypothetical protein
VSVLCTFTVSQRERECGSWCLCCLLVIEVELLNYDCTVPLPGPCRHGGGRRCVHTSFISFHATIQFLPLRFHPFSHFFFFLCFQRLFSLWRCFKCMRNSPSYEGNTLTPSTLTAAPTLLTLLTLLTLPTLLTLLDLLALPSLLALCKPRKLC